ncbi:MAG: IS21 family transposase [Chloroflexi bacterium]|nr:IS21 family transposase [Chloroflexota bacterium]
MLTYKSTLKAMANNPITMSKIRHVLRLYFQKKGKKAISEQTGVARNTIKKYLTIFKSLNIPFDELKEISDSELEKLFIKESAREPTKRFVQLLSIFPTVDKELKRRGVTRQLLWEKYRKNHSDAFGFTQFCKHYKRWKNQVDSVMHIDHKAGDKVYVDYAGEKLYYVDPDTGEVITVEVFLAILGASQLTYVEATMSQQKEDFIASCERSLHYYNGVPKAIVSDNLKSAVTKSDKYEPTLNEAFEDFCEHYSMTALPAKVYRPRYKALVEGVVKIMYTRIYAMLKLDMIHSLEELNQVIRTLLEEHNNKALTGRDYSRRQLFDEIEKEALQPLPAIGYEFKKRRVVTVSRMGYAVLSEDKHYYHVPYQFKTKKVTVLYSADKVDIFHHYDCVATYKRDRTPFMFTTNEAFHAPQHQFRKDWTPERMIERATVIGNDVKDLVIKILEKPQHPDQSFKSCSGVLNCNKKVGPERLNNACRRAMEYGLYNYKIVQTILEKKLDMEEITEPPVQTLLPAHENIRGESYFI